MVGSLLQIWSDSWTFGSGPCPLSVKWGRWLGMGPASQGAGGEWVATHQRGCRSQHPRKCGQSDWHCSQRQVWGCAFWGAVPGGESRGQRLRGGNRPGVWPGAGRAVPDVGDWGGWHGAGGSPGMGANEAKGQPGDAGCGGLSPVCPGPGMCRPGSRWSVEAMDSLGVAGP